MLGFYDEFFIKLIYKMLFELYLNWISFKMETDNCNMMMGNLKLYHKLIYPVFHCP